MIFYSLPCSPVFKSDHQGKSSATNTLLSYMNSFGASSSRALTPERVSLIFLAIAMIGGSDLCGTMFAAFVKSSQRKPINALMGAEGCKRSAIPSFTTPNTMRFRSSSVRPNERNIKISKLAYMILGLSLVTSVSKI